MFNVVFGLIDGFAMWMRQMLVWPGGLHKAQISMFDKWLRMFGNTVWQDFWLKLVWLWELAKDLHSFKSTQCSFST